MRVYLKYTRFSNLSIKIFFRDDLKSEILYSRGQRTYFREIKETNADRLK